MRYLRMIRAFACYHAYLWWPRRWLFSAPAMAILPYAGQWANAEAIREAGDDPWGPPNVFRDAMQAAVAYREIKRALDGG